MPLITWTGAPEKPRQVRKKQANLRCYLQPSELAEFNDFLARHSFDTKREGILYLLALDHIHGSKMVDATDRVPPDTHVKDLQMEEAAPASVPGPNERVCSKVECPDQEAGSSGVVPSNDLPPPCISISNDLWQRYLSVFGAINPNWQQASAGAKVEILVWLAETHPILTNKTKELRDQSVQTTANWVEKRKCEGSGGGSGKKAAMEGAHQIYAHATGPDVDDQLETCNNCASAGASNAVTCGNGVGTDQLRWLVARCTCDVCNERIDIGSIDIKRWHCNFRVVARCSNRVTSHWFRWDSSPRSKSRMEVSEIISKAIASASVNSGHWRKQGNEVDCCKKP